MGTISNIDFFKDAIAKDRTGRRMINPSKTEIKTWSTEYTEMRKIHIQEYNNKPPEINDIMCRKCMTPMLNVSKRELHLVWIHFGAFCSICA